MDNLKKQKNEGSLSEDALHDKSDDIQKVTDRNVKEIDALLSSKESEILEV